MTSLSRIKPLTKGAATFVVAAFATAAAPAAAETLTPVTFGTPGTNNSAFNPDNSVGGRIMQFFFDGNVFKNTFCAGAFGRCSVTVYGLSVPVEPGDDYTLMNSIRSNDTVSVLNADVIMGVNALTQTNHISGVPNQNFIPGTTPQYVGNNLTLTGLIQSDSSYKITFSSPFTFDATNQNLTVQFNFHATETPAGGWARLDTRGLPTADRIGSVHIRPNGTGGLSQNIWSPTFYAAPAVPEPGTYGMMALGLLGVGAAAARGRRRETGQKNTPQLAA